jgi:CBS domain-containing protein
MTRDLVWVTAEVPLEEVARPTERRRIKRVPALDGDSPVGIVSRADLLRAHVLIFAGRVPPE